MGLEITVHSSMAQLKQAEWDGLDTTEPIMSWGFLSLLEASGSVCPEKGWTPCHFSAQENNTLIAAAPFYVKTNSMGEFVFDYELADLANQIGAVWYPKLVGMVPFTPIRAWQILSSAKCSNTQNIIKQILDKALQLAQSANLGGVHILWPNEYMAGLLSSHISQPKSTSRWLQWNHHSFLWENKGYTDFNDYLNSFSKNMRRNVKRDKESVHSQGITTCIVDAQTICEKPFLLEKLANFYFNHNKKFGPYGALYLTKEFFTLLPEYIKEGWMVTIAYKKDKDNPLAMAFLLESQNRLYGRYWGCNQEISGLHFDLCYYLPIEYAIAKGIKSFDPGMGGTHKARRGFCADITPSYHNIFNKRLQTLLGSALPYINSAEDGYNEEQNKELPFKSSS